MKKLNKKAIGRLLKIITHVGAWIPLAWLVWQYQFFLLGADPVREITLQTGTAALVLLVLSLACTPVNILLGWKQVLPLRRPLGLYGFFYVCLHFLTFIWLDYGLDLGLIVDAVIDQNFVLVGFLAFVLLVPLAATSTRWAMRRLGKNWKRLHRSVYIVAILAIIHFIWLVKNVYTEPLIYAAIVAVLLLTRIKPIKQKLLRWQRRLKSRRIKQVASVTNKSVAGN